MSQKLSKAKSCAKKGKLEEARILYQAVLDVFPQNKRAQQGLADLLQLGVSTITAHPPRATVNKLIDLCNHGMCGQVIEQAKTLTNVYPESFLVWNILGVANQKLGRSKAAIEAFRTATVINPMFAEGYYNIGFALQLDRQFDDALKAYNQAVAIRTDYAEAYNNLGIILQYKGALESAISAYKKAISTKSDYAEAFNNMGNALGEQGNINEAISAYKKAISVKADYAEAFNNMGNALGEQGELEEASKAYKSALACRPDYAEAHRNLSLTTLYTSENSQVGEVETLLRRTDLKNSERCHLLYAYAKMQEDLGNLSIAFESYVLGGKLRQKLLAYQFQQDINLFEKIKTIAAKIEDITIKNNDYPSHNIPIFILGMPRSGTTLVEQIVSSHSEIFGAGELRYISQYGSKLATGQTPLTLNAIKAFRERYLAELSKRVDEKVFITDKMPQNFLYIPLICAAFPEAKIIHVQRLPEATCWSNFKHYFVSEGLGYSYDLGDTVRYYGLYKDLMKFWSQSYKSRIIHCDYDKLTENQEAGTRFLIENLGFDWEENCLEPQNNKRIVKTASQKQVRHNVYRGSSQVWRNYESLLDGIFDTL